MAGLASRAAPRQRWRLGGSDAGDRLLIEEQPIAMVHDSTTTAVMMATPADLEDFIRASAVDMRPVSAPDGESNAGELRV